MFMSISIISVTRSHKKGIKSLGADTGYKAKKVRDVIHLTVLPGADTGYRHEVRENHYVLLTVLPGADTGYRQKK